MGNDKEAVNDTLNCQSFVRRLWSLVNSVFRFSLWTGYDMYISVSCYNLKTNKETNKQTNKQNETKQNKSKQNKNKIKTKNILDKMLNLIIADRIDNYVQCDGLNMLLTEQQLILRNIAFPLDCFDGIQLCKTRVIDIG